MSKYLRIGPNKRDSRGNIIYYESREGFKKQYILKHYQEFDEQNRKVKYYNSDNRTDLIHYNGDKISYIDRYQYKKNTSRATYSKIEFDKYGQVQKTYTYLDGTRTIEDHKTGLVETSTSPFIRIYDYPSVIF